MDVPVKVFSLLVISHKSNPLIESHFKFLILFLQFFFISFQMNLFGGDLFECLLISLYCIVFYMILILLGVSERAEMLMMIGLSLFSTIALLNLFQNLVNDFITF